MGKIRNAIARHTPQSVKFGTVSGEYWERTHLVIPGNTDKRTMCGKAYGPFSVKWNGLNLPPTHPPLCVTCSEGANIRIVTTLTIGGI